MARGQIRKALGLHCLTSKGLWIKSSPCEWRETTCLFSSRLDAVWRFSWFSEFLWKSNTRKLVSWCVKTKWETRCDITRWIVTWRSETSSFALSDNKVRSTDSLSPFLYTVCGSDREPSEFLDWTTHTGQQTADILSVHINRGTSGLCYYLPVSPFLISLAVVVLP